MHLTFSVSVSSRCRTIVQMRGLNLKMHVHFKVVCSSTFYRYKYVHVRFYTVRVKYLNAVPMCVLTVCVCSNVVFAHVFQQCTCVFQQLVCVSISTLCTCMYIPTLWACVLQNCACMCVSTVYAFVYFSAVRACVLQSLLL